METLLPLLQEEVALSETFFSLLKAENACLHQNRINELEENTRAKEATLSALAHCEGLREKCLESAGWGAGIKMPARQRMESYLEKYGSTESRDAWKNLVARSEEIQQQAKTNTQILSQHMQRTEEALGILLQNQESHLRLYGSDGQTARPGKGRINDAA